MGMAASQARFLGLTARKNNVEFEGQQVNQQRTTLSNQSANYYNDLLGMSVPVPPSVDDYTKTVYTFEDGALTNQITAMIAQNDGTYALSYLRQWTDDFSVVMSSTSIVNTDANKSTFKIGATTLRELGSLVQRTERQCTTAELAQIEYAYVDSNGNVSAVTKDANGTFVDANGNALTGVTEDDPNMIMYIMDNKFNDSDLDVCTVTKDANGDYIREEYNLTNTDDEYLSTLSESQLAQLMEEEEEYLALCQQKYGTDDYLVRYIKNTSTGEYNPYFYKKSDLTGANYDSNGNSLSNINCYTIGSETKSEEVKSLKGCQIEKDSSGRYINVTIPIYNSDGTIDTSSSGTTYALTTSTATDQDAYEDAMNQYEYEKYEYDQSIQEINAKIEIIQAEDKNLELRLKQLDTEQKAISTEIDAVSQVIQKNTESSFKTFG